MPFCVCVCGVSARAETSAAAASQIAREFFKRFSEGRCQRMQGLHHSLPSVLSLIHISEPTRPRLI
eukprot:2434529-Rhodomonas_salina.2